MLFRLLLLSAAALVLSSCSMLETAPAPVAPDAPNIIQRSGSVEYPAWGASDVVIADEGAAIDGWITVTDSWYGSLEPGQTLHIPELRQFADPGQRVIELFETKDRTQMPPTAVSCRAMLLLIDRKRISGMEVSVTWFEADWFCTTFTSNLGPTSITAQTIIAIKQTRSEVRQSIMRVLAAREQLQRARALSDEAARVSALKMLLWSEYWRASDEALDALAQEEHAVEILRGLLLDETLVLRHYWIFRKLCDVDRGQWRLDPQKDVYSIALRTMAHFNERVTRLGERALEGSEKEKEENEARLELLAYALEQLERLPPQLAKDLQATFWQSALRADANSHRIYEAAGRLSRTQ